MELCGTGFIRINLPQNPYSESWGNAQKNTNADIKRGPIRLRLSKLNRISLHVNTNNPNDKQKWWFSLSSTMSRNTLRYHLVVKLSERIGLTMGLNIIILCLGVTWDWTSLISTVKNNPPIIGLVKPNQIVTSYQFHH